MCPTMIGTYYINDLFFQEGVIGAVSSCKPVHGELIVKLLKGDDRALGNGVRLRKFFDVIWNLVAPPKNSAGESQETEL